MSNAPTPSPDDVTRGEGEPEETGPQMLGRLGMDGAKWAAEFRATALRLGYSDMDEGWLIGWFCNAIMAGYDRAPAPTPSPEAVAKAALEYIGAHPCLASDPDTIAAIIKTAGE